MDSVWKWKKVISNSTRVCIYPKDVQRITGKRYLQARLYLIKIKKHFNKEPHHLVSIEEFCEYTGLQIEHVVRCIVGWKNREFKSKTKVCRTLTCSLTCLNKSSNKLQSQRQICKFTHQDLRYFITKYEVRIRLVLQCVRLEAPKTLVILSRFDSPRLHKKNFILVQKPVNRMIYRLFCF